MARLSVREMIRDEVEKEARLTKNGEKDYGSLADWGL